MASISTESKNRALARTLVVGVAVSFALLVAGLLVQIASGGESRLLEVQQLRSAVPALLRGEPAMLVHLGVICLFLTPVARLVVLAIEFLIDRQLLFAGLSLGILCLLGLSIALGLR